MNNEIRKAMAGVLIVVTLSSGLAPAARAGTISTESALASDRERILIVLDRPEVRSTLEAHGVTVEEAKARVAALTDAEAAQLAQQIDSAPAGADANPLAILLLPIYVIIGVVWLLGAALQLAFAAAR